MDGYTHAKQDLIQLYFVIGAATAAVASNLLCAKINTMLLRSNIIFSHGYNVPAKPSNAERTCTKEHCFFVYAVCRFVLCMDMAVFLY